MSSPRRRRPRSRPGRHQLARRERLGRLATTGTSRCESTRCRRGPGSAWRTPPPRRPAARGRTRRRDGRPALVGAERAYPDHRVGRVVVDICARGEVHGDPGRGQPRGRSRRRRLGHARRRRAEREVPGSCPGRPLRPGDVTGLLVGRHDRCAPGGEPQDRRQLGDAGERSPMLSPKRQTPPRPPSSRLSSQAGAAEPRNDTKQAAVDHGVEVHVSP